MLTRFASYVSFGAVASWRFRFSSAKARYVITTMMESVSCNFLYRYFALLFLCAFAISDPHVCCGEYATFAVTISPFMSFMNLTQYVAAFSIAVDSF